MANFSALAPRGARVRRSEQKEESSSASALLPTGEERPGHFRAKERSAQASVLNGSLLGRTREPLLFDRRGRRTCVARRRSRED